MKEIQLTQGFAAIVDDEDFEFLSQWSWCITRNGYAKRGIMKGGVNDTIYMHRAVIGASADSDVDHANGNKLDNRKANLRIATVSQNGANSKTRICSETGFKGVVFNKKRRKFQAWITLNRRKKYLGQFSTPQEAHAAYSVAAKETFGEFARV